MPNFTELMTDGEVIRRLAEECRGKTDPMICQFDAGTVFHLVALVQLALRHPGLRPGNVTVGKQFIANVTDYFADCPTVVDVIRRGGEPSSDVVV